MNKNKNGITLIALVITIIVLLILAGISISLVTGQNGVLTRAEDASNTYSMSSAKEQANMRAAGYVSEYTEKVYVDNDLGIGAMTAGEYVLSQINGEEDGDYKYGVSGSTITVTSKTTGEALASGTIGDDGGISWSDTVAIGGNTDDNDNTNTTTNNQENTSNNENTTSSNQTSSEELSDYVGCYINKGTEQNPVYAIIYADLLVDAGKTLTGVLGNVTMPTPDAGTTFKTYSKSASTINPTGSRFGANYEVTVTNSTGVDRFLAMALTDVGSSGCWYYSMFDANNKAVVTATEVGTGVANTSTMVSAWNDETYGTKNGSSSHPDVWGLVTEGWFLPSRDEWKVFGALCTSKGVTGGSFGNYHFTYGLSSYWSSSQDDAYEAWITSFDDSKMQDVHVNGYTPVRLSTTF